MVGWVLTVHNPYAWALVAGFKTTEERAWTTSYRGRVFIHAGKETDLETSAELWPPDGQLLAGAAGPVVLAPAPRVAVASPAEPAPAPPRAGSLPERGGHVGAVAAFS